MQESRAERLLKEGAPELLWRYQPDEPEVSPEGRPLFLMRALLGGTVYVGAPDGYIHALHADSGERLWSYQAGGNVHTSPAQIDGSVFFASEDGNLYALDAASGELLWQHETDSPPIRSSRKTASSTSIPMAASSTRWILSAGRRSGEVGWT